MTKFEDNQSPYITFLESAAPGTPASTLGKLYVKTDGILYFKNDAGTETSLIAGASGIPATIFDAKGDLIAATAADTASRLAAGANGTALTAQSGQATGLLWTSVVGLLQSGQATRTAGDVTTTSTTYVDLTSMTVTLTTGARRCLVIFSANGRNNTAGNSTRWDLDIDGSRVGQTYGLTASASGQIAPIGFSYLTDVLSAASHTLKIVWSVDGTTGTTYASTGVTPAKLHVIETGLTS